MRAVDSDKTRILVVNYGGRFYAIEGICTHETADLSLGFLNENRVTCSLHLSHFDVTTGAVLNPPGRSPSEPLTLRLKAQAYLSISMVMDNSRRTQDELERFRQRSLGSNL